MAFKDLFTEIKAGEVSYYDLFTEIDSRKTAFYDLTIEISTVAKYILPKKELFVDFGPNGNFEISSVTSGYFKAVLIGVLPGSNVIAKVEGVESHSYDGVKLPSFSLDFKPVAIIIVGSDMNILQKDIIPVINFTT